MTIQDYLKTASDVLLKTAEEVSGERVEAGIEAVVAALSVNKPLLVCGNGGSASDAMHITGELVGRFFKERRGLNCICLSDNAAVLTAWSNDYSYETVFARQVEAYGQSGGVIWGLSTSGNSENVVKAFEVARDLGMVTIGMTGAGGGKMAACSDILIEASSTITPEIQQTHLCLYHYMCEEIEKRLA